MKRTLTLLTALLLALGLAAAGVSTRAEVIDA